jgi:MoaA/NifB/PqqE/SkfB family radical SAM enzyme
MKAFAPYAVTWGRVAAVLRESAARGVRAVHFTGGEPTIHVRFHDALVLAKKLGMRTSVGTIGTMLCRKDFAERVLPVLDEALFSLHGPTADVHDALTGRPGSFDRVTGALRTCLEIRPDFGAFVNTVVVRDNVACLPDTVELADRLGARLIVVSNATPEGAADDAYADLAVPLDVLAEVLPRVPERAKRAVVRFFGTPMCLLGEHWVLSNDLHWDARVTYEWTRAPGKVVFDGLFNWAPDRKRVHVDACRTCSKNGVCTGVFDRYAERFATSALRPL